MTDDPVFCDAVRDPTTRDLKADVWPSNQPRSVPQSRGEPQQRPTAAQESGGAGWTTQPAAPGAGADVGKPADVRKGLRARAGQPPLSGNQRHPARVQRPPNSVSQTPKRADPPLPAA